jgi:2-methylisocitrate lyase-like PEP mutase family enzyme
MRNLAGFSSPQLEQISTLLIRVRGGPTNANSRNGCSTGWRRAGRFAHDVVMDRPSQGEKGATFEALHVGAPFIIPNPWDAGSAKVLAGLGFQALASTSSGFAFTLGRADGGATLDEVIAHTRALDEATPLPVSVDLENGYGPDPARAAEAIERVAEAGAVGGSIEDYDPSGTIYDLEHAVERIAAACEAARSLGFPFVVTARAENHIRGNPDLADTIVRLQAYERAGADALYAPGLATADEIRAVCESTGKPVNVLARPGLSMAEIVAAGAQRVSVGGSLAWVAAHALVTAATEMRDTGDFSSLDVPGPKRAWLTD